MKRFYKILAILFVLLLIFTVPPVVSLISGHSAWAGLLVSFAILFIIITILFIRALWLRRREKKFIDGILDKGKKPAELAEEQITGDLIKRWKDAVYILKKSQLRLQGNPLYVLPWYMVIGESGSGKTTAIRNSKLSTTFTPQARVSGVSGTRNCDWWFFEQAVIIDTAGRYAIQPDERKDRDEWKLFLSQLAKYRKKEPLNGLVVTVAADRLLTAPHDELEAEGLKIRMRIEELMQTLGAVFPVYLLVTKCDLVRGMTDFCDFLPTSAHDQAMGCLKTDRNQDMDGFLTTVFHSLFNRIRHYRLHIASRPGYEKIGPEALLFPEEFERVRKGLEPFIKGAFTKNAYKEAPYLRGMYFTSGRQSGSPLSRFIENLSIKVEQATKAPTDRSYFLQDFFKSILPADRREFEPTTAAISMSQKIRIMGLSAWALGILVLCGVLSYSFALSYTTLRTTQRDYTGPADITGVLIKDVVSLSTVSQSIETLEASNKTRWIPWLGLEQCLAVEKTMKADFCKRFSKDFMGPYGQKLDDNALMFTDKSPSIQVGKTVGHYARRINLLEKTLEGNKADDIEKMSQPDFTFLMMPTHEADSPKAMETVGYLYRHYLAWAGRDAVAREAKHMKDSLIRLAAKPDLSLRWMTDWVNESANVKGVTLGQFWPGTKPSSPDDRIPPSYTVDGFNLINGILAELEQSLDNSESISRKKREFLAWYKENYANSWLRFTLNFPYGEHILGKGKEEMTAVQKMPGDEGPYFAFIDKMAKELAPCLDSKSETPVWIGLVLDFSAVKAFASAGSPQNDKGLIGSAKKGIGMISTAGKVAAAGPPSPEVLMKSGEAMKKYRQGLEGLSKACASLPSSLKLASDVFSEDPAVGESPLAISRRTAEELKATLPGYQNGQKVIARLIDGPVDFLWSLVVRRAGCQLQKLWMETVISEVQGAADKKAMGDMMLGKEGLAKNFAKGPASPFMNRDVRRGYYGKTVAGKAISFRHEFFTYLSKGSVAAVAAATAPPPPPPPPPKVEQSMYKVKMEGLPTDSNPDASSPPHATKLELSCASGTQTLDNYNFPVSRTFSWAPAECGDVTLKIIIGDKALTKEYTGTKQFARFLKDFSDGQHTFYRSDFPDQEGDLKRMGIKFIKVRYAISGGGPVMALLAPAPSPLPPPSASSASGVALMCRAPEVIVSCSD